MAIGRGVEVGVGVGEGVGFGDWVGLSAGLIDTPLFQTNLPPCLMQVYLIFETILVVPDLLHFDPAIAPLARLIGRRAIETVMANNFAALRTKQNIPFCNFI